MTTLQQFRYLVAIADTLHFRRAAQRANVTQPTLSRQQLREFEEKLGVQLVERSRFRVVLTSVGAEIAVRCKTILHDVDRIVEIAKHGASVLGGTMRIGILHSLGPYLLPHVLPEIRSRYPSLKTYIREGMPGDLVGDLEEGDLGLLVFPLPVNGADLASEALFHEPLWVVAPKDHRLASRSAVRRADLREEAVLTLEHGHRLHEQVRELCDEFGARLSLDYEGTSLDTIRQMVGMGMGISFLLALYVCSEVLHDRQVEARRLSSRPPFRAIGMVWRRTSSRAEEFRTLAALFREQLSDAIPDVQVVT